MWKGRAMVEPVDVVMMWVDDTWPGYREGLAAASGDPRDLAPNRTRDNLGILRYGMRSLAENMPNLRRIYLFTMRPQVPAWLNTDCPDVHVVHHDEVIAPEYLPTYNSFCIMSHVHLLPGLTERFFLVEDDQLWDHPAAFEGFVAEDGRPALQMDTIPLPRLEKLNPETELPWNLAQANVGALLSEVYGDRTWRRIKHGPLMIDKAAYADVLARYNDAVVETRASKFRSPTSIAPEVLYPLDQWASGKAVEAAPATPPTTGYAAINDYWLWTWYHLRKLDRRKPRTITLNDGFGAIPNPRVEAYVRRWLDARYPEPCRFEKAAS